MNLTSLVRKLESQLKAAEKLARRYDLQAKDLRGKLTAVASTLGKTVFGKTPAARKRRKMCAAVRARIGAAQRKRWAAFRARHNKKIASRKRAG
jgi:hypothetical protein